MTAAPIIIPAPTLRRSDGELDLDATARYAQRFAGTWAPRAIISGPMGRGEECTEDERGALLEVWCEQVPASRLVFACWERGELNRAEQRGVQPLVMLQAGSRKQLLDQINATPEGVWLYANPRYSSVPLQPADVPAGVAGVKMSKTSGEGIRRMREANPGKAIVHGSSRDIRSSLQAGADWVTAAPLAVLPDPFPAPDLEGLQGWLDRTQHWLLDGHSDHDARVHAVMRTAFESI